MSAINQFKIVSLGQELDTYDDLDISLTYQIDDIEDITSKKSSFSKTIVLPGTPKNNEYFKNIFDVNIDISQTSYNPKKALPVQVLIGDEQIFTGNLQLLNIITNQKQVDYEIVITGVFKNIIIAFSDYYLNQLNLDEYDHYRNVENITYSYNNIINIGNPNQYTQAQPGTGYIYPLIANGQNNLTTSNGLKRFYAFDLNPAVYVKTIMDKLFEFAGYTYTSTFFNSDYFRALILPTETPQYNSEEINDKTVRVTFPNQPFQLPPAGSVGNSLNVYFSPANTLSGWNAITKMLAKSSQFWSNATTGSWYFPMNVETGIIGNEQMQDPNNEWQTSGVWRYVNQTPGFYSIDLDSVFNMFYKSQTGAGFIYVSGTIRYIVDILKVTPSGQATTLASTGTLDVTPPGANVAGIVYGAPGTTSSTGLIPSGFIDTTNSYNMNLNVPSVWLNTGDNIRVRFRFYYGPNTQWTSNTPNIYLAALCKQLNGSQANRLEIKPSVTNNYNVNNLISLSTMMPTLKMREFFIDIVKMFNLMITDNPNKENDLIIEPRDVFFESKRKVRDWTHKLDYDQDITQTPMSELDTKTYRFSYAEDVDYYNNLYEEQTGKVYGEYTVDFLNDFSTEEKRLELKFAPTVNSDNIVTPLVIPFFADIDTNNSLTPKKVKPRILFSKRLTLPNNKFYVLQENPAFPINNRFEYVYAGMYDDPFDPEYSLEFGNSNVLYYNTSLCCPSNTLVNQFYLSTLNDITDVNSKLLEAYFHLTPSDINQFDFRDIILIDNAYWRVNRIVDYNPNAIDKTTKVILYKLNYLDIFFNNNKEVSTSAVDCPEDIVAKLTKQGYIYVSLSNTPITEACCLYYGGVWSNGMCKVGKPIVNNPNGGLPNANPSKANIISERQTQQGSIYLERPFEMLKNLNVINSDTVLVKGENNYIDAGASNSIIVGEGNSVPSGVTNVMIVGDNIDFPTSNSLIVGDIKITSDGIGYYYVYLIDGGLNTVMNAGKTNFIDLIDGGFNSVRNFGGDSKLRPIISGANGTIE